MDRSKLRWSALVGALLAAEGVARAADGASAADGPGLDERTAFLVGAHTLKLGILAFEYGFNDKVSLGSDPPFWLARTALPVLDPQPARQGAHLPAGAGHDLGGGRRATSPTCRATTTPPDG